jgi:hypothetical protein
VEGEEKAHETIFVSHIINVLGIENEREGGRGGGEEEIGAERGIKLSHHISLNMFN